MPNWCFHYTIKNSPCVFRSMSNHISATLSILSFCNSLMLKNYYKLPIMCLLRIKDSIDTWEKRSGSDGYFDFIESYMGSQIKGREMKFTDMSPESLIM